MSSILIRSDLLQVRAPMLNSYVMRAPEGLYLLDSGFIGGRTLLSAALRGHGWERKPIRGIIVTHGHLDHILNVHRIARDSGAWVAAPALDAAHCAGRPRYRGWARVTGLLEKIGRPLLGFREFTPDRWLEDGDRLDVWHGLRGDSPSGTYGRTHGFLLREVEAAFLGGSLFGLRRKSTNISSGL